MPPTRRDVLQMVKTQKVQEKDINMGLLETAAVKAAELTGHPGWDRFLEQCQALLNTANKEKALWTENTVNAYTDADMRFAQRNVTQFNAQVELLTKIMKLPREIMDSANAAGSE